MAAQAQRVQNALTGSTGMLAIGLLIVLVLVTIGRRERRREANQVSLQAGLVTPQHAHGA